VVDRAHKKFLIFLGENNLNYFIHFQLQNKLSSKQQIQQSICFVTLCRKLSLTQKRAFRGVIISTADNTWYMYKTVSSSGHGILPLQIDFKSSQGKKSGIKMYISSIFKAMVSSQLGHELNQCPQSSFSLQR
jgi:hypothetical protein